jgi:NifB/MoaA-like Fe-S oxidoreductase
MTNKDFRLSKSTKRALSTITDKQKRDGWKRMMIDAEVSENKARTAKLKLQTNQGDE